MRTPSAVDLAVTALAERQHGLVARPQLLALGLGGEATKHRVRTGRLIRVARGVYALGRRPAGHHARWWTGLLLAGDDAVLSHLSAAALWGLRSSDGGRTSVTIPTDRGRARAPGLVVHRSALLTPELCDHVDGLLVTSPAWTLLDVAAAVRPHELRRALVRSEELELFDLAKVEQVLELRAGQPGVPALRFLLDDARAHGLPRTRNDFEALFFQMCLDHGLPRPQVNRWDGARELDFRWPDHRVVVETDGWGTHRTRSAFESDLDRSQILAAQGWKLVRVSYRQLTGNPSRVAQRLALTFQQSPVAAPPGQRP